MTAVSEYTYRDQLQAHVDLQEMLSEETPRIYRVATKDAQGNDIDEYKYHENKWPTDYTKMKTNEENEKYDTGNGDETSSRYPREPYSLEKPSPHASFTAASAAFLRTHDKVNVAAPKIDARQRKRIELDLEKEPPATVVQYQSKASMTKFTTLVSELSSLREAKPNFRVIVFTRHSFVQERLVKLIGDQVRPGGSLAPAADRPKLVQRV